MIRGQRGVTIVSVLVAAGIGAIVMSAITSMIINIFKSQRAIQAKDASFEIVSNIRDLLKDSKICTPSFNGSKPIGNGYTRTQIRDSGANVKYQTGVPYLNNLIQITSFEVKNYDFFDPSNPKVGKAELNVHMIKLGSVTGPEKVKGTIYLKTTLNALNNLMSCTSMSANDSLWQISPANSSNIYYSDGFVGIGTTNPTQPLQVVNPSPQGAAILLQNTDAGGRMFGLISSGTTSNGGAGKFHLYEWNTPRSLMVFDSAGKAGIGTVNPNGTLDVNGGVRAKKGSS